MEESKLGDQNARHAGMRRWFKMALRCAAVAALGVYWLQAEDFFAVLAGLADCLFIWFPAGLGLYALLAPSKKRLQDAELVSCLAVAAVLAVVGLYVNRIEPRWLAVTHYEIQSSKLTKPVRIVVLADIQTDEIGAYERRVLTLAAAQQPDLVLFAGDNIQAPRTERPRLLRELNQALLDASFEPTLGMAAVPGNVDFDCCWKDAYLNLPVACLENAARHFGPEIEVVGLDLQAAMVEPPELEPAERFCIVLGHAPDFALRTQTADLMVAGHTHGGQVRIPFYGPIITFSRVPRDWAAGLTQIDDGWLFVSRGIGMERGHAPRMRFFCRPELAVITVLPK